MSKSTRVSHYRPSAAKPSSPNNPSSPRRRGSTILIFSLSLLIFSACTKEKRELLTGGGSGSGTSGPATLSSIQEDILFLGCAVSGCHDNHPNPAADMNLTSFQKSYAAMVNIDSSQNINLKIILPSDAENSYLVQKLSGTHLQNGGSGDRMPQFAAPLSSADINRIAEWINMGAMLN